MRMVILWSAVQEMNNEISDLKKRLESFKKEGDHDSEKEKPRAKAKATSKSKD